MTIKTKNQFIEQLKKSKIASNEILALWCKGITDDRAQSLAKHLVENGHLSPWQAKQLMAGRHRIKFGNHILTDRISKDELATQYLARQAILDRRVKLTFLNDEISQRLDAQPELVRQVVKTADFEHANLEHLHLIEKAGDRFFLVSDYTKGRSLNDPDLIEQLDSNHLDSILSDAFSAISMAHQHGLSHGALSENDLLIDENQTVKVQNMVLSYLVHSTAEENRSKANFCRQDTESMVRIGKRLVSRLNRTRDAQQFYDSLFQRVLAKQLSPQKVATEIRNRNLLPKSTSDDKPEASATSKTVRQQAKTMLPPQSSQTRRWIIPAAVTSFLSACVLIAYFAGWMGDNEPVALTKRTEGNLKEEELPSLGEDLAPNKETGVKKSMTNLSHQIENPHDFDRLPDLDDGLASESSKRESLESDAANVVEKNSPSNKKTKEQPADSGSPIPDSLLEKFNAITQDDRKNSSTQTREEPTGPLLDTKNSKPEKNVPEATKTEIPNFVGLPKIETSETVVLANWSDQSNLKLKLISDENVLPNKVSFSLQGNQTDGWTVRLNDQGRQHDVAHFTSTNQQLQFNWQNTASSLANATQLVNCLLKIELGQHHFLALRKPVAIKGFKFDRKKPLIRLEVPGIEAAPPEAFAQLDKLAEDHFGEVHLVGDDETRHFTRKKNLEIHFSDLPEYQLIYLTLSSDLKKKYRLDAALKLNLDPRKRAVNADAKSLESAKAFLESSASTIQQQRDYLKDTAIADIRARLNLPDDVYPDKKRDNDVKLLTQKLELTKERAKKFRETISKIQPFFDKTIPVTIYFMVGDHRVVLASTSID